MFDLSALVRAIAGERDLSVRHPSPPRVRVVEGCPIACPGCTASTRRGSLELDIARHAFSSIRPFSSRVLLAGADPLTSSKLPALVSEAHQRDLEVELLTPGVLLTPHRATELKELGITRLRVALDPDRKGYPESLKGAAAATWAGLAVDLHLAVDPDGSRPVRELISSLTDLPVQRIVVSDGGCRAPSPVIPQWTAASVARSLLAEIAGRGGRAVPVCVEGLAFHERLLHEAVEGVAGTAAARKALEVLRPAHPQAAAAAL